MSFLGVNPGMAGITPDSVKISSCFKENIWPNEIAKFSGKIIKLFHEIKLIKAI